MSLGMDIVPLAILRSQCGDLVIYDIEAVSKVVSALPVMPTLPPVATLVFLLTCSTTC